MPTVAMARKNSSVPGMMKEIVDSPTYKDMLRKRAEAGILAPNVEVKMWEYVFGKPADEIHVMVEDYSTKSIEELMAVNADLQKRLDELSQLEAMLAAEEQSDGKMRDAAGRVMEDPRAEAVH